MALGDTNESSAEQPYDSTDDIDLGALRDELQEGGVIETIAGMKWSLYQSVFVILTAIGSVGVVAYANNRVAMADAERNEALRELHLLQEDAARMEGHLNRIDPEWKKKVRDQAH
jgi:hypothetical protein